MPQYEQEERSNHLFACGAERSNRPKGPRDDPLGPTPCVTPWTPRLAAAGDDQVQDRPGQAQAARLIREAAHPFVRRLTSPSERSSRLLERHRRRSRSA